MLAPLHHEGNVVHRVVEVLHPHGALQHQVLLGLVGGGHHPGAVDEEDSVHERHVLPHFRLPSDGRHIAHLNIDMKI